MTEVRVGEWVLLGVGDGVKVEVCRALGVELPVDAKPLARGPSM